MKLHELKPAVGSTKNTTARKRTRFRGGSTSGRGHKGAQSRSGYTEVGLKVVKMRCSVVSRSSVSRTTTKFTSRYQPGRTRRTGTKDQASALSVQLMVDNGNVGKKDKVKILGRGELKSKVSVEAHAFSATATKAIENVGGTATKI